MGTFWLNAARLREVSAIFFPPSPASTWANLACSSAFMDQSFFMLI